MGASIFHDPVVTFLYDGEFRLDGNNRVIGNAPRDWNLIELLQERIAGGHVVRCRWQGTFAEFGFTAKSPRIWRIGFMTQKDMGHFGMEGKVAVYMPHAYAISGWVIITESKNVKPAKDMTAGEAMKFAVSGGITTVEEQDDAN